MIGTDEDARIALLFRADLSAAMATDVQHRMDTAIRSPRHDHLFRVDAEDLEIVDVRDHALMRDTVPVPAEDTLHVAPVNLRILIKRPRQPMPRPMARHKTIDAIANTIDYSFKSTHPAHDLQ